MANPSQSPKARFEVGDCVHLRNRRGRLTATRCIGRVEYDATGVLWAGFLRNEDGQGIQWFHVPETNLSHPPRRTCVAAGAEDDT